MKQKICILLLVSLFSCNQNSKRENIVVKKTESKKEVKDSLLKFEPNISFQDFIVEIDNGKPRTIDFSSNVLGRKFHSVILNNYQKRKNLFAGHYSFIVWGCGSPCQMSAIIDYRTGKIYEAPNSSLGYEFKPDSKMIIVNPPDSNGNFERCSYCVPEIYVLEEETKKFILKKWK